MKSNLFALCASLLFVTACLAHNDQEAVTTNGTWMPTVHIKADDTGPNPWTNLLFNNEDGTFQFAIVSDRTGGHRKRVFEDAITKLNLLQPEFVMSVGDMIEGYTNDEAEIRAEWDEFDSFVKELKMPFFYLPGNHDISNPVMADIWEKRHGTSYYDFRYNDVLFVVLNSNDGNMHKMGAEQVKWLKGELEANKDVRWTLLFIHAPLWDRKDKDRWPEVEELLKGRDFTAFAGHNHNYVLNRRGGHNYYTLATTGGSSGMRGIRFGEFDHVVWVTMRKEGPVVANLMLDGIWPGTVSTREIDQFQQHVLTGAFRFPPVLFRDHFESGETQLRLTNNSDLPCKVTLSLKQIGPVIIDTPLPNSIRINPNDVLILPVRFHAGAKIKQNKQVSELEWSLEAEIQGDKVVFNGKSPLIVSREEPIPQADGIVIDGKLNDWPEMTHTIDDTDHMLDGADSWQGPADASMRWSIARKGGRIYVAAKVMDAERQANPKDILWRRDNLQVVVDARPKAIRINNQAVFDYVYPHGVFSFSFVPNENGSTTLVGSADKADEDIYAVLRPDQSGYTLEMSIPEAKLDSVAEGSWDGIRFNIILTDRDPEQSAATVMVWNTPWMNEDALPGTGCFYR